MLDVLEVRITGGGINSMLTKRQGGNFPGSVLGMPLDATGLTECEYLKEFVPIVARMQNSTKSGHKYQFHK